MIRVGDIVRYEHPVENRKGCGRVLDVDERFVTVDGECCGLRMRVRVKHGKAWLDEKLMEVMTNAKRSR